MKHETELAIELDQAERAAKVMAEALRDIFNERGNDEFIRNKFDSVYSSATFYEGINL